MLLSNMKTNQENLVAHINSEKRSETISAAGIIIYLKTSQVASRKLGGHSKYQEEDG